MNALQEHPTLSLEVGTPVKRPALRYHGGKFRIAPWIISQFPEHKCYCEVFGGAAGVLLRKPRSHIEVWNDVESQIVTFWRCLRDSELRARLIEAVALTPYSRDEFEGAYEVTADPIEIARRLLIRTGMGHGTCAMDIGDSNGFRSRDLQARKSYAREWAGVPDALVAAAERFTGVTIENISWEWFIPKYDSTDTLFYVDPPYPMSTRNAGGKGYSHELSDQDHRALAWALGQVKGKVVVSGYQCRLYAEIFKGWRRLDKETTISGQLGSTPRTESIWMNYDEVKA